MRNEISQAAEAVASHPKTSLAVAALANANVWWLDYGEPIVKALTSILGLGVLLLLFIKHFLDIKKALNKDDDK